MNVPKSKREYKRSVFVIAHAVVSAQVRQALGQGLNFCADIQGCHLPVSSETFMRDRNPPRANHTRVASQTRTRRRRLPDLHSLPPSVLATDSGPTPVGRPISHS